MREPQQVTIPGILTVPLTYFRESLARRSTEQHVRRTAWQPAAAA
jgi:hypothetical protein